VKMFSYAFKVFAPVLVGFCIASTAAQAQMFENCIHNFEGNMRLFVRSVTADETGQIIAAANPDYDRDTKQGSPLSAVGKVTLDEHGIVTGSNAKSGWVNVATIGMYLDESGAICELTLQGVSFWVDEGGKNWWDFEVGKVVRDRDKKELTFTAGIQPSSRGDNLPFLLVDGRHKLITHLRTLQGVYFVSIEVVQAVQRKLMALGHNPGVADGIWGDRTEAAVMQFQKDNDLPVTGWISAKTLQTLVSP